MREEKEDTSEDVESEETELSDLDASVLEELSQEVDKCRAMRMNSLNFARDVALAKAQHAWETSKEKIAFTVDDIIEDAEKVFMFITKDTREEVEE